MRVNFILYGAMKVKDGRMTSPLASARYRVIQPMSGLVKRGHFASYVQISVDSTMKDIIDLCTAEIVVISKVISPARDMFSKLSKTTLTLVDRLHDIGRKVVADISDNYFEHAFYGPFYRDLVSRVDAVASTTAPLAAKISQYTDRDVAVISDPYEGPFGEARFEPPPRHGLLDRWFSPDAAPVGTLRLVWFGHPSIWQPMRDVANALSKLRGWAIELEIITAPGFGIEQYCEQFNARHPQARRLRFTQWSLQATWRGLARADLVVIPSWPDHAGKVVKGANRLVETLQAGRFAVVNALPSYLPLAPYCWIGESIIDGLKWALGHPSEARGRIAAGQAAIRDHYSPQAIAASWEALLARLSGDVESGDSNQYAEL